MQSKATTVLQYLSELPADRRIAIEAVRDVIVDNLDKDYEEGMQGMICYYVPHSVFPDGYHCDPRQPLPFAAIASQKNYMSVYLMSVYGGSPEETWFRKAWARTGKKLDMGKCCVRFKNLDGVALDVIGEAIRRVPAAKYIEHYVKSIRSMNKKSASDAAKRDSKRTPTRASKPAARKPASRKPAKKAARR